MIFKTNENQELSQKLEDAELDVTYEGRWKQYRVKLQGYDEYKKHEELIKQQWNILIFQSIKRNVLQVSLKLTCFLNKKITLFLHIINKQMIFIVIIMI